LAHDRRTGNEQWAWLAAVPDDELDRDWQRVTSSMAISLQAVTPPTAQRVGDLVVYCGARTGVLSGVGEVVGEPRQQSDEPTQWRLRILVHLLLDRGRAPSIAQAGMRPPHFHTRLDSAEYLRLRELMLSAAVSLGIADAPTPVQPPLATLASDAESPGGPANGSAGDQRTGDEPWAWLAAVPEEALDRDWERVTSSMTVSLQAASLPTMQRLGDLVVYCGAGTGVLTGVGEVVGEPLHTPDAPTHWRLRVLPQLLLDRRLAPSIAQAGMQPPRLPTRLDSEPYSRVRELMLSAAVPLGVEGGSNMQRLG
jgi:hypothetical protein